jgi:uncharacterized protein (DUF1501 family)
MTIQRRTFLQSLGLGAGAFALSSAGLPQLARAQTRPARNFVFCYFSGGWDTLLSLDTRDPSVFTEARVGETGIELAWDRLDADYRTPVMAQGAPILLGPAAAAMARHGDKMCVVRGISMDTVTHEVGRRYFLTGMVPRGSAAAGSSMGTRIVSQQGDLTALPHLVSRTETYNEGEPAYASGLSVSGATDLLTALQDGPAAPRDAVRRQLDAYRARGLACDPAQLDRAGFLGLIRGTQTKARALVASGVARHFQFGSTTEPEMVALRSRYGFTSANQATPGSQAALAFQALKHGVAQVVTVELADGLDTHDTNWSTDHAPTQAAGWTALSQLVADLASEAHPSGGSFLEHTTVVAFSEFGRTARLNNRDGRDHSLTSACMLLGAGVPHGKVVGASSDVGMNPQKIDPVTGRVDDSGVALTPTRILASVMESAGLDTTRLRERGLGCLMA